MSLRFVGHVGVITVYADRAMMATEIQAAVAALPRPPRPGNLVVVAAGDVKEVGCH